MAQDDTAEIIGTFEAALGHPVDIFLNMGPVTQITTSIALVCLAVGVVVAVISRLNNAPRSGLLTALGVIGLIFGLLGAAYGGLTTYIGVQDMHVTRVVIYLPELIEIGLCVLIGLLAWLVAQMGNAGARRA
jgi:hypothetical protein